MDSPSLGSLTRGKSFFSSSSAYFRDFTTLVFILKLLEAECDKDSSLQFWLFLNRCDWLCDPDNSSKIYSYTSSMLSSLLLAFDPEIYSPISSLRDRLDPPIDSLIDSRIDSLMNPAEPEIDSRIDSFIGFDSPAIDSRIADSPAIDSLMADSPAIDSLMAESQAPDNFSKDSLAQESSSSLISSPMSECSDFILLVLWGSLMADTEMVGRLRLIIDFSLFSAGPGFFCTLGSNTAVGVTVGLFPFLRMAEKMVFWSLGASGSHRKLLVFVQSLPEQAGLIHSPEVSSTANGCSFCLPYLDLNPAAHGSGASRVGSSSSRRGSGLVLARWQGGAGRGFLRVLLDGNWGWRSYASTSERSMSLCCFDCCWLSLPEAVLVKDLSWKTCMPVRLSNKYKLLEATELWPAGRTT